MSLKSENDWSGRMVNGVILGTPAREFYDESGVGSGGYVWDGGVPDGDVNVDGDVMVEATDDKGVELVVKSEVKVSESVVEELADFDVRKKDEGVYVPDEPKPDEPKPEPMPDEPKPKARKRAAKKDAT